MNIRRFVIFVSSVQKEFAEERRAIKDYILNDPLFKLFISEVFLFEDIPAKDRGRIWFIETKLTGVISILDFLEMIMDMKTPKEFRPPNMNSKKQQLRVNIG